MRTDPNTATLLTWPPEKEADNIAMYWWLREQVLKKNNERTANATHNREAQAWEALLRAEQGDFDNYRALLIEMQKDTFGERFAKRAEAFAITFAANRRSRKGPSDVEEGAELARVIEEIWRAHYPVRPRKKTDIEWSAARFAALVWLGVVPTLEIATSKPVVRMENAINNRRDKAAVDAEPFFYRR
jgi:hypothetical protein